MSKIDSVGKKLSSGDNKKVDSSLSFKESSESKNLMVVKNNLAHLVEDADEIVNRCLSIKYDVSSALESMSERSESNSKDKAVELLDYLLQIQNELCIRSLHLKKILES